MKNWKDRLKQEWDENPVNVMLAAAVAVTAAAKLLDAVSSSRSRHAYAKQIDHNTRRRR